MRYGRYYALVKFNVFIIAQFPSRPRTKRATMNRRFLALLSVVSPFNAIATKRKTREMSLFLTVNYLDAVFSWDLP